MKPQSIINIIFVLLGIGIAFAAWDPLKSEIIQYDCRDYDITTCSTSEIMMYNDWFGVDIVEEIEFEMEMPIEFCKNQFETLNELGYINFDVDMVNETWTCNMGGIFEGDFIYDYSSDTYGDDD